jgi:hypothetical protein
MPERMRKLLKSDAVIALVGAGIIMLVIIRAAGS